MLLGAVSLIWAVWILGAVAAFFVVKELFRKDEQIEDRRRHALAIADELTKEGLEHIPGLLHDYAVGDYSGIINRIRGWYLFLQSDDNRRTFFLKFLRTQLQRSMQDESRRAEIIKAVEEWEAVAQAKAAKLRASWEAEAAASAATGGAK